MAKKKDKNEVPGAEEEKSGNKVVTVVIALLIVFIWLAVFALLIKLDVGGFGSGVLRPLLKDVPIVNRILPEGTEEEIAEEENYEYTNLEEANEKIKELQLKLEANANEEYANSDYVAELKKEIERLQKFEDEQKEFQKRVKQFNREVVFGDKAPDITEYQKYYEGIDAENAAELYQMVIEQLQVDQKVVDMADRYAKMEPDSAAQVLELMTAGDLQLVCDILSQMKPNVSSLILAEMDTATAAKITKYMTLSE